MSSFSKNVVDFVKAHRLFFISTLILLTFLLECFMVRNLALKQIMWLVIITLVNLYICERRFKANDEPLRYFNSLFFFGTWVGLLLFFFWGFWYYSALTFPVVELSPEAQGLVAKGLNWRTLLQLAGNIIVISVIINLNWENKPRNPDYGPETRYEKKIRILVQRKLWYFKYYELYVKYTYTILVLGSVLAWSKIFNITIPYVIKHHVMGIICTFYTLFLLWTFLRIVYIMFKTTLRENEIDAKTKKK